MLALYTHKIDKAS